MELKVSESIGFCYGVRNAVDLSKRALSGKDKRVFSIGPIIHNPQVVKELLKDGLMPIDDIDKGEVNEGTIIISSHGAGAKLLAGNESASGGKDKQGKGNLRLIDATCPFVKNIQNVVKRLYEDAYKVIIIGKKEHPEVKALVDFTDGKAVVIKDAKEAERISIDGSKIGVVSQSTFSQNMFLEVASILLQRPFTEIRIFNTICRDTVKRQEAVRQLADEVDIVIVVGGRNSANTQRLVEACKEKGRTVYHIEDGTEINPSWFIDRDKVGIAGGTSTPDWVVQDVIETIEKFHRVS